MPVKFRCTGCRSKLYVPARWTGTSIECPRCKTRVVVPEGAVDGVPTTLEGPEIERSLDALEPPSAEAFDAAPFSINTTVRSSRAQRGRAAPPAVKGGPRHASVTLPAWVPYALAASMVIVAVASFFLGAWWAIAGRSP